jgi:hypothetical protein
MIINIFCMKSSSKVDKKIYSEIKNSEIIVEKVYESVE